MHPRIVGRTVLLVLALVLGVIERAHADEVAPELEGADLRTKAQLELRRLVSALPPSDQRRLTGIYVAFDASVSDPVAQVACDDDGDYVVLLSDAMLRVASHVARASAYEEGQPSATRKVEAYASFVARVQLPGRRLLPPPQGFYAEVQEPTPYADRLTDTLGFIIARELAHLRRGDLVCPKPTPTKERGDDVWTSAEQRQAADVAPSVYQAARDVERDTDAVAGLIASGHAMDGGLALLRFFAHVDAESRSSGRAPFRTGYATLHRNSAARLATVTRAASPQAATSGEASATNATTL